MADQKISTRQRQLRELEDAAQVSAEPGDSADPEFVVPGPGGQFVGEAEDDGQAPPDLVVRDTESIKAAKAAAKDARKDAKDDSKQARDDSKQRGTDVQRGDTEPGTSSK